MKIKAIGSAFFAAAILLSAVGCGNAAQGTASDTSVVTAGSFVEPSEKQEITDYVKDLAAGASYSGRTFTYLGGQTENFPTKEEETGDIISDALFFRQRDITELYGLSWENVLLEGSDEVKDSMIEEVMAGGSSYDLVFGYVRSVGRPTLNAGILHEMQNLDHVDITNKWWNQSMNKAYRLDGKLYFLLGPINTRNYLDTNVILFNKNVTKMFGVADKDLYDSVKEGKWTIDKMFEISEAIPENSSGTGVFRFASPAGLPFLFGSGYTITKFDEDGLPYVEKNLPRELSDLADKIVPTFTDPSKSAFANESKEGDFETKYGVDVENMFDDDRALFMFPTTSVANYMRQFDVQFGILPIPKLNETQKEYYCSTNSWEVGAVYMIKSVADAEMVGRITESMAALSQIYVKDAYYDKLLKSQSIFDLESSEMLDIIFASKVYDMADLYCDGNIDNLGPFIKMIEDSLTYDNSNFSSLYKSGSKLASINIKNLIRLLKND